jgi:type I restriction enzyme S subunit
VSPEGTLVSPLGPTPEGWTVARLKDITKKIGSGATPKGGDSVYLGSRHRFALIRSQNVFDRRFDETGLAYISDPDAAQLRGVAVEPNDVLLNITGDGITFARTCIVPESVLPACVNQHVSIVRADTARCIAGFLVSYLTHPVVKAYIESFNAGGSRRAITKGHIESFVVPIPPLNVQHAIAELLGMIDDKIDLNRRMNETLKSTARAVFKSWFVDFDPVRAKMGARQPAGMDPEVAALFPAEMTQTAAGPIPFGWRMVRLGEVADVSWGDTSTTKASYAPDGYLAFSASGPDGYLPYFDYDRVGIVLSAIGANAGITWLAQAQWSCIKNTMRFWSSDDSLSTEYLFYATQGIGRWPLRGSAQPFIAQSDARNLLVLRPAGSVGQRFGLLVVPIHRHIHVATQENRTLSAIRDALLPKLLSGEIRIRDAEEMLESHL